LIDDRVGCNAGRAATFPPAAIVTVVVPVFGERAQRRNQSAAKQAAAKKP